MNLTRIVPQPVYWCPGYWLWLNMLYDYSEIRERMSYVNGEWCEKMITT